MRMAFKNFTPFQAIMLAAVIASSAMAEGCSCAEKSPDDRALINEMASGSAHIQPGRMPGGDPDKKSAGNGVVKVDPGSGKKDSPKGADKVGQIVRQIADERGFMAPASPAFEGKRRELRQKIKNYSFGKNYKDDPLKTVAADLAAGLSTRINVDPKIEGFKVTLHCQGKKARFLFSHLFDNGIMTRVSQRSDITFGPLAAEDEKRKKITGKDPFADEKEGTAD